MALKGAYCYGIMEKQCGERQKVRQRIMKNLYYIGGSPCSGKSTVAEILSEKYDLYYFKVDDFLEKYRKEGAARGYEICGKQARMDAEETWMRDPELQCREEFVFYREIFELIQEDLSRITDLTDKEIIAEGAAFLPELMQRARVSKRRYVSITPEKEFQISHFKTREWLPLVLEGCRDQEQAFANWIERDHLFARGVQHQCLKGGYLCVINDGSMQISELVRRAEVYFGLGR